MSQKEKRAKAKKVKETVSTMDDCCWYDPSCYNLCCGNVCCYEVVQVVL
jgi:hypothetical protein